MAGLNRYAQKRRHKRKQQERYMLKYSYGVDHNLKEFKDRIILEAEENKNTWWGRKHPARNDGWEYWQEWYLTGRRQYAKKYSDKRIRQKYRQLIRNADPEDITAPRGADYEKEYDYVWTIW